MKKATYLPAAAAALDVRAVETRGMAIVCRTQNAGQQQRQVGCLARQEQERRSSAASDDDNA
ncbi:MAG: hypothetical protein FWE61_02580, partial [Micrococcales bacterium]|nr:hypothetical protein [Micrococcales bacterium]